MWTATIQAYIAGALTILLGMFVGYFFKGYLTKKGENLATHEDISKLIDQVKAVTEATKKIETEMSIGVWDKQKRWDMKREVLFEAARRLSMVEEAWLSYSSTMIIDLANQSAWATAEPTPMDKLSWKQTVAEELTRWSKTSAEFDETRMFVGIVCGQDAKDAFDDLGKFINVLVVQIRKAPDTYASLELDRIRKILLARNAVRKELEVDT
jgi:hypothetical protein